MIMLKLFCIIFIIIVIALLFNGIEDYSKDREEMRFKEAMDLVELPVVTFYQGKEKFHFLLDTGSNYSHISSEAVKRLKGEIEHIEVEHSGVGEGDVSDKAISTTLEYKSKTYKTTLLVGEHLDTAFKNIKESTGVQIHGIIGNGFMSDNCYILDFDCYIAYSKV